MLAIKEITIALTQHSDYHSCTSYLRCFFSKNIQAEAQLQTFYSNWSGLGPSLGTSEDD